MAPITYENLWGKKKSLQEIMINFIPNIKEPTIDLTYRALRKIQTLLTIQLESTLHNAQG